MKSPHKEKYTLAIHTMQRTDQKLQKSLLR
jgi:hypothetical protein